jgi:hypothetical protein
MPVARIVTRYPQCAGPASDFLQERGYGVEVVDPVELSVAPADFEFALEKSTPEQARARAEQALFAYESQASAGAIQPEKEKEERVVVAYDIAGRPVEFASPMEVREERRQRPNTFTAALVSFLDRTWDELDHAVSRGIGSVREVLRGFGTRHDQRREEKLQWRQAQVEEKTRRELALAEQRAAERARRAVQKQEEERQRRLAEDDARERRRQAEVEAGMAWVRERQARQTVEREAQDQRRREQERRTRAEAEAGEHERQAQIAAQREAEERTRIEAQRERERTAAEREAAVVAERERARAAAEAEQVERARWASAHAGGSGSQRPWPDVLPWHSPSSSAPLSHAGWQREQDGDWKKAFALAASVIILVMLGMMAYGNRRSASPLSLGEILRQNAIQQQAPFGPATVKPQVAPEPSAAHTGTSAAQAAAGRKAPQKATPTRRLRADGVQEKDALGDDEVVVRHYPQRRQPDRKVASSNGVKRYSDLE